MLFFSVIAAGIIAVSMASVLIKLCAAPAMVIAVYRLALAALFFVAGSALKRRNHFARLSRSDLLWAALSGLFLALHFATWITSLEYTSVATSVVLVATSPVFVGIGGMLFLKERPGKLLLAGIVLTIAGSLVISWADFLGGHSSGVGNLLALSGAVAVAGYPLVGRRLRKHMDTLSYVTVVYSFGAVILLVWALLFRLPLAGYSREVYFLMFLIAFIPQVIGHTSFNWALQHVSAATVAVIALGEPIGAPILALFILGEKITAIQLLGGMFILIGVGFALRGEFHAGESLPGV